MSARLEAMSSVDNAWLRMEGDTNLMMISVLLVLEKRISRAELEQLLQSRLLKYDRFRQKVSEHINGTFWEDDPHFQIGNHVHEIGLPGKGCKDDLEALASDLTSTPLNLHRPLWEVHLIDHVGKGCALLIRVHHCIADGISLVRVMLSLTDDQPSPEPDAKSGQTASTQGVVKLANQARQFVSDAMHTGESLWHETRALALNPRRLFKLVKAGWSAGAELGHIATMPNDPATCFRGELSGRKHVSWAEPMDLRAIKKQSKALGVTINDLLMAAASGALSHYLNYRNVQPTPRQIHVAVPFNLRPLDQPIRTLGNEFGLVIVPLPVGHLTGSKRLQAVRKAMQSLKEGYQAQVFYGMLSVLGKGPAVVEQTALEVLSQKASLVMTNVPGPTKPLYLAGSKLLQPMVWVPQSGSVGLGLSILSYNQTVQFGVVADHNLVPDPQVLVNFFQESVDELLAMNSPVTA